MHDMHPQPLNLRLLDRLRATTAQLISQPLLLLISPSDTPITNSNSNSLVLPNDIIHNNSKLINFPHQIIQIQINNILAIRYQQSSQFLDHPDVITIVMRLNDFVQIVLLVMLEL